MLLDSHDCIDNLIDINNSTSCSNNSNNVEESIHDIKQKCNVDVSIIYQENFIKDKETIPEKILN